MEYNEENDLFQKDWDTLPIELQDILYKYCNGDDDYETCSLLVKELESIGYTCNYGLDAEPYNLRKII